VDNATHGVETYDKRPLALMRTVRNPRATDRRTDDRRTDRHRRREAMHKASECSTAATTGRLYAILGGSHRPYGRRLFIWGHSMEKIIQSRTGLHAVLQDSTMFFHRRTDCTKAGIEPIILQLCRSK